MRLRRKKIRVLGEDWSLKYEQLAESHDDSGWRGSTSGTKRTITLDPEKSGREDLLHEVIHAIEFANNMSLGEGDVQKLARGLWAVSRDNPWFLDYLRDS